MNNKIKSFPNHVITGRHHIFGGLQYIKKKKIPNEQEKYNYDVLSHSYTLFYEILFMYMKIGKNGEIFGWRNGFNNQTLKAKSQPLWLKWVAQH